MLTLPGGLRVFIATKPMDMRRSFDGLAAIVEKELKQDIFQGSLFVFCNRRGDRIKTIYWDRNGYAIWYKRLEQGVFRIPRISGCVFTVTVQEFNLILEGVDLTDGKRFHAIK